MNKLKKRIIYEYIIICICITIFTLYIMGLIIPNIYFSDFILSTIQVILVGAILMVILPLYFRDLRIADEKSEAEEKTEEYINATKSFWSYCITVSLIIFIVSIASFLVLWVLVLLLNLTSLILNRVATILAIVMTISLLVGVTIYIIRESYKKPLQKNNIFKK